MFTNLSCQETNHLDHHWANTHHSFPLQILTIVEKKEKIFFFCEQFIDFYSIQQQYSIASSDWIFFCVYFAQSVTKKADFIFLGRYQA